MTIDNLFAIPIESCYGVGTTIAKRFHKIGIHHAWDLLMHLPRSYENRSQIMPFSALRVEIKCLCQGIIYATSLEGKKRNILRIRLKEDHESGHVLHLIFFHFTPKQAQSFQRGKTLRCFGTIKAGIECFEMIHPELQFLNDQHVPLPDYLIATYPASEGLAQFRIRQAINPLLNRLGNEKYSPEPFHQLLQQHSSPELAKFHSLDSVQALYRIHRPPLDTSISEFEERKSLSHQRLSLEELSAHRLGLKNLTNAFCQYQAVAISPHTEQKKTKQLLANLGFQPTQAQQRCYREIIQAMQSKEPIMHLLQGDVGSGKTLVAILVMLAMTEQGYKSMLMVPTELLAQQHYQTLNKLLTPLGIIINFLCGKQSAKQRRRVHAQLTSDQASITVGTHALFQDKVEIKDLALIVIDEQHRFGVGQRFDLLTKSQQKQTIAHQLLISATPIPRTLAMSLYGDLSQSVLDEMPSGRKKITTYVMSNTQATTLSEKIGKQCAYEHRQAYWVCPFIEESEVLNVQSATGRYEQLCQQLPQINIALMHGKLKEEEKNKLMADFRAGLIQLLVATTVIEVGVDVANASIMVVENAERMGLSQLHQLRGRVGRGHIQSQCIFLYQPPLWEQGIARLNALKNSNDGFYLAQRDLEMRGAGELIGYRQSGMISFRIANMIRDGHLIPSVNELSDDIHQDRPALEQALLQKWGFGQSELGKV